VGYPTGRIGDLHGIAPLKTLPQDAGKEGGGWCGNLVLHYATDQPTRPQYREIDGAKGSVEEKG